MLGLALAKAASLQQKLPLQHSSLVFEDLASSHKGSTQPKATYNWTSEPSKPAYPAGSVVAHYLLNVALVPEAYSPKGQWGGCHASRNSSRWCMPVVSLYFQVLSLGALPSRQAFEPSWPASPKGGDSHCWSPSALALQLQRHWSPSCFCSPFQGRDGCPLLFLDCCSCSYPSLIEAHAGAPSCTYLDVVGACSWADRPPVP